MPGNSGNDELDELQFADIGKELLQCLEASAGRLLELAGYRKEIGASPAEWKKAAKLLIVRLNLERPTGDRARGDQLNELVVEVDELMGILAQAVFARVHNSSSYSAIVDELRSVKEHPRSYAGEKPKFSIETETLVKRQLLKQKKNRNTAAVFDLAAASRGQKGRLKNIGNVGKAAAAALDEIVSAQESFSENKKDVAPVLRPFLEKPVQYTNRNLANSLRKWLTKVGPRPSRTTQDNVTTSNADEFLDIILPVLNDIIERHNGKKFSHDTLAREMSKGPDPQKT